MITFNRNILYPILIVFNLLFAYCSIVLNTNNYLLSFLTFIYLMLVPGFLIIDSIKLKKLKFWNLAVLSIGLSISFLMIPGIIFNSLWPFISDSPPLQTELLTGFYGFLIIILIGCAYIRNAKYSHKVGIHIFDSLKKIYFIIPPVLTILSIFSTIALNNGSGNILAIICLSLISLMILGTVVFNKTIDNNFLPWSLYFYSLSILLMLSLRSLYVSGWDIQSEFAVFQLTDNLSKWSPIINNGAYNACLSITLLPTVISKLTSFPNDYIYKLLYQILFAITPVIAYLFFRKFTTRIIAFIAVIYIMSQPLFIQPMTALMRQEIAFIFFMMMSYILFDSHLNSKVRIVLLCVFSFSMVLSHYSTTYIAILLLTLTFIFTTIFRISEKIPFIATLYNKIKWLSTIKFHTYYLHPFLIVFLFISTLFWYGYVNNQLGQIQHVATEGLSRMNELFQSDSASNESKKATSFLKNDYTTAEDIQEYTAKTLINQDIQKDRLYPMQSYANSNVHPLTPTSVKPLFHSYINYYLIIALEGLKQIFKLCVIAGPIYLLIFYFKKHTVPREYIVFCLISVAVIFLVTFHPYIGRQYNLSRLYLQLLFYLSLPTILLVIFLLNPFKKVSVKLAGILVVIVFAYLIGIPNQILGGEAKMYLNNFGADYDKFYMFKEEFASAEWLKKNVGSKLLLYADREAYLRIFRVFDRGYNANVLPALIYMDGYVYGSYANVVNNRTTVYSEGSDLLFTFPRAFLEENKNVIYSNGKSTIYR